MPHHAYLVRRSDFSGHRNDLDGCHFGFAATICNGHAELCTRRYSNVTFMGAHDSFAYSIDPLAV
ncbi:uncharacterized protein LACBIDRAFT_308202 [Laccaria bicolor S238N-H82]|uniref:Predicted protein n=1 Tax=Laccaria bicolor (strain S238N-H82 / ATCC MYA-4686) TaxID=486041 RepID=B0DRU0_LACBS|nr:uncharacterized protein LACBIDRAFT_308202 [Laccaria bicolor S238N-H82]EDR02589.1 predicted protein [Laccaria bicolor S238N-H82]|eukprot:XP_001886633.1 predicted protein [Laccaria bicolor S238N-H82]